MYNIYDVPISHIKSYFTKQLRNINGKTSYPKYNRKDKTVWPTDCIRKLKGLPISK